MFSKRDQLIVFLIFVLATLLVGLDIIDDLSHGSSLGHVAQEAVIVFLCALGATYLVYKYVRERSQKILIKQDLTQARSDLEKYRNETKHLVSGLSQKIDQQFEAWGFSTAEKEVAMLLLKGLSNKEIAQVRNTSDKTISQQTTTIYQKSGLHSRSELSAFFLEDLFIVEAPSAFSAQK